MAEPGCAVERDTCDRCGHVPGVSPPVDTRAAAIVRAADAAREQAQKVASKLPPFASPHEAYAVIAEELAEFFDEVRKKENLRGRLAMRRELIDIACAAIRAASELEGSDVW